MENATKALLIAAGVLIAVMIISAAIYLFVNYSEVVYNHEQNRAAQNQVQYNNKFEKFVDKELTAQDVLTIINLKDDYNVGRDEIDKIKIELNNFSITNTDKGNFEFLNAIPPTSTDTKPKKYVYRIKNIEKDTDTNTINIISIMRYIEDV